MGKQETVSPYLIWIDMEMTGLDPDTDRILEVALVATDNDLNVVGVLEPIAVHQSDAVLAAMDAWCQKTHGASGLIERVRASTVTEAEAEAQLVAFMAQYVQPRQSPMCGNSICQDRRFLYRYMPKAEHYFHYRNLDVSTIKELAKRWAPEVLEGYEKESAHTALADIMESIEELRRYRAAFFSQARS
ncbi:oligoribonuclease [Hydrogenophilus thermoluteolus]|jgi:oligoribonuclease|uniref:oligoribonuclease n=1 Tax=Hydrogenophilus thermoluteolus TaxID=297 RepID=UPI000EDE1195|nr:oligoribonuclease [Hydrogenophilus thermoluteolus]MBW7656405.1 oligoribonuclease [Hydrogenophilus thermoluteolus]HCO77816.1 oligoribonuclease [Rhodocyclaceae bacterium]HNQ49409.1 oligoribonuclease [Hydrogenophilus thermoluteolus]